MIELNGIQISDNNINTKKNVKIYTDEKQLSNVVDKEVHPLKGALKDLHTPIAISSENTTESMAQNVRNIADFVAKAKAAGIADVNGMVVSCIINDDYSGVGYLYGDTNINICGIISYDDVSNPYIFDVDPFGEYIENEVLTATAVNTVTSSMLTKGARNPIILTKETTEVDEETYQKLLSDDVDVVFKASDGEYCALTYKEDATSSKSFYFTCFSVESDTLADVYIYGYRVSIIKATPHTCTTTALYEAQDLDAVITSYGFTSQFVLSPVLQEIDLRGTDAERKAKLDQFETDWKALTGASDLTGARFVGIYIGNDNLDRTTLFILRFSQDSSIATYEGISMNSDNGYGTISKNMNEKVSVNDYNGSLTITPLFSHLEAITIYTDNTPEHMQANLDNIAAYEANLQALGVDISSKSHIIPFSQDDFERDGYGRGYLVVDDNAGDVYLGQFQIVDGTIYSITIDGQGKVDNVRSILDDYYKSINAKSLEAITIKTGNTTDDKAANVAAIKAYRENLVRLGIYPNDGYQVSVVVTSDGEEYTGTLNIGTGALLSGIVTDVNETHHYPFHIEEATGIVTFDKTNYFLEKTSTEVTEMLDAIKYSYTPVPLTATASTNKTQLDSFLSKVPNAQIMHCTYKDVYAGTLHKIGTDWFGQLVKNTNNYEDCICIKLAANGTVTEGTTSLQAVNAKLDTIIG